MVAHPGTWIGSLWSSVLLAAVVAGPAPAAAGPGEAGVPASGAPELEFAQPALDLGVGSPGSTLEAGLALHNGSQVVVDGLELTIDPADGPFSVARIESGCAGGVLAPGAWCRITVAFSPSDPSGDITATLLASGRLAGGGVVEAATRLDGVATPLVAWPVAFGGTMASGSLALTRDDATDWVHAHLTGADAGYGGFGRSGDGGRSWRSVRRMSDEGGRVAAAGRFVYVATNRSCGLALMRNRHHGARPAWEPAWCISTARSDGDRYRISAAGRKVYVASLRPETGRAMVRTSRDRGVTWRRTVIADAGAQDWGIDVAASGSFAVVAWSANGATWARVSIDGGRHWRRAVRVATGTLSSADARGARLVLAGTAGGELWLRRWDAGVGWQAVSTPLVGVNQAGNPAEAAGPIVALGPSGTIGLAYGLDRAGTRTIWECMWSAVTPGSEWQAGSPIPRDPGASARCHDAMWMPDGRPLVLASARTPSDEEAGRIAISTLP